MMCPFICLGFVTLLLGAILCRRAALNALESVNTREQDTLRNVQFAIKVLWGNEDKVTFTPTKDRCSELVKGASRRKSSHVVAKMLSERKKRDEKIQKIRSDLAAKLKFRKIA